MTFKQKGFPMHSTKSALKQTRETSWWSGEEGWIPDEWQGIKRPEVKDQAWHDVEMDKYEQNLKKEQKEKNRAIIKEYGSLQNEPVPESLVKTHRRREDGSLYYGPRPITRK